MSAPPCCSAGSSCASGSRRRSSAGSKPLPALLVDNLGEGPPATGLLGPSEVGRIGGIAERQQVFAGAVGGIAEKLARDLEVVDGGGHAADPELPGRQHHVLGGLAQVEAD